MGRPQFGHSLFLIGSAPRRINSRVSEVYTWFPFSRPDSNGRLEFKRLFEPNASRDRGVFVIFHKVNFS
jgi:hypothetical protein